MRNTKKQNVENLHSIEAMELREATAEELDAVSGGTANIYYNAATGTYILRDSSQVYVGPGVFVGTT